MTVLLSNQQRFLLEALDSLGGAKLGQLTKLLQPVFCIEKPEAAPRIVEAAIRQMERCNISLCRDGDLVYLPGKRPATPLLEAIDVMLELSCGELLNYRCGKPPILLRFAVQEQKVRLFAVTTVPADLYGTELYDTERIIMLFDGHGNQHALPVPNKQFLAIRQDDGTHRFYAADGQTQRR